MAYMRLDKLLSTMGWGSRKDVKEILKKGLVTVDGSVVKRPETKINTKENIVMADGEKVEYIPYIYLMLHKPAGAITATESHEPGEVTVLDFIGPEYAWFSLFPVGRLDKDTEGLLILTNDGIFSHRTLSPKKRVEKTYYAKVKGMLTGQDVLDFKKGISLDDGWVCAESQLRIVSAGEESEAEVVITEGRFHQVKRMFESLGKQVVYLKRIKFAGLCLDESLKPGEYRELNEEEMKMIAGYIDNKQD